MKNMTVILVLLLCLGLTACKSGKEERMAPVRSTNPIMDLETTAPSDKEFRTAVYVTVYGSTAYLASYPYEIDSEELEMGCNPRNISNGGSILAGCAHEREEPITEVVILEPIGPKSTANWFRNMTHLRKISHFNNLRVENVEDMSHMFSGCTRLDDIPAEEWDVSGVVDMTGMFDGCDALSVKPSWYHE